VQDLTLLAGLTTKPTISIKDSVGILNKDKIN